MTRNDLHTISAAITELGRQFNLSEIERTEITLLGLAGLAVEMLQARPDWSADLQRWLLAIEVDAMGMPPPDDVLGDEPAADSFDTVPCHRSCPKRTLPIRHLSQT